MGRQRKTETTEKAKEPAEKLTLREAVCRAIAEIDGDTTYSDILERAIDLLRESGDVEAGDEDTRDKAWKILDGIMDNLADIGLLEQEIEVRVHPLVPRIGKPNGGNGGR